MSSLPVEIHDLGLWNFMRVRKRFWLLPITIIVLLIAMLEVWLSGHESGSPSRVLNGLEYTLF